ncbi:protein angel [Drosophila innubila]|uniref:protein angel n=1 Tax=Drosophila innubila TaxID=198719 RepID=UPI00148DE28C|nr:protein angel [Drosophila innubila]
MSKSLFRSLMSNIIKITRKKSSGIGRPTANKMEPRYDYNRQWTLQPKLATKPLFTFKLISYNILAQDLLMQHLYLYMNRPEELLTWRHRLQKLQREIIKLDPDILCLQEMQYDHLAMLVQRLTANSGKRLEYVYKKKTGNRTDGCAIIYDATKFKLISQHGVELYDMNVPLLDRENVALLAKFRLKQSSRDRNAKESQEVVVATTHLLFNPRRSDVRCAQVTKLLNELHIFAANSSKDCSSDSNKKQSLPDSYTTPVILTGDFNSEIDTPPMTLIRSKGTDDSSLNFKLLNPGDYTASTYQHEWITVDYIMHSDCPRSKQKLDVLSVYLLPKIHSCANAGYIPNHYLGSDHYSLGAVFALVPK